MTLPSPIVHGTAASRTHQATCFLIGDGEADRVELNDGAGRWTLDTQSHAAKRDRSASVPVAGKGRALECTLPKQPRSTIVWTWSWTCGQGPIECAVGTRCRSSGLKLGAGAVVCRIETPPQSRCIKTA